MEPIPGDPIRPVEDIIREHVEATLAAHPDVPRYRIAMELGWSPTTLYRRLEAWAGDGESTIRDRR